MLEVETAHEIGHLGPLIAKLGLHGRLTERDETAIADAPYTLVDYQRNQRIATFSKVPPCVYVLTSGIACLSIIASDGRRQITRLLLPGDFCNAFDAKPSASMEGIDILAPTRMAAIPDAAFRHISASSSMQNTLLASVIDAAASARVLIASLGRGNARSRVAFLLCDLARRMTERRLLKASGDPLPLRQEHIADATGLTGVHVNRMLAQLRRERLLSGGGTIVQIADMPGLRAAAGLKQL
ncbi:Crp/Fnr family transcriptional regulator [Sphingomonas aurantiaca]|uniref:Crp/Fnr family transcriptional regulator n=1 Tax=Sphingomonas aurantiaca TaxID=185949 RepID=UPI001F4526E3|nr:Crp/Fnr family transcriptional regulator [Sphingomonas aurantiaca]